MKKQRKKKGNAQNADKEIKVSASARVCVCVSEAAH